MGRALIIRRPAWALWFAVAVAPGVGACRAKIAAEVAHGPQPRTVAPAKSTGPLVRVFDVESLVGLHVDAATSGLGLEIAVPQDVSTTPAFQLTVNLVPSDGEVPLFLTLASELESLERPTTLVIPKSMLPGSLVASRATLIVKDLGGTRRVVAPDALSWTDSEAVIKTSQPMGEWSFTSEQPVTTDVSYLAVAVSGLAADESLRYEVKFLNQTVLDQTYDIALRDSSIRQKVTGNETRYISAPVHTSGNYFITVLEGPLKKICLISPETGPIHGLVPVAIACGAH